MKCKFLEHGLTITYDRIAKPCCEWKNDPEWEKNNKYDTIDITNWHQSSQVLEKRKMLERGIWPDNCISCKKAEESGRVDSMRGNGNSAYANYSPRDITVEIRPGNICNFACQTCWPKASSRVGTYLYKAGLIQKEEKVIEKIEDFDFLLPVADRIKNIVLLGGEPFYDPHSRNFLKWSLDHDVPADQIIFTNGSIIDYDFLEKFKKKVILVFSLDAIGLPSEYIRFGSEWQKVEKNFIKCLALPNIEVRSNITISFYNIFYLEELIYFLIDKKPDLITFGEAFQDYMSLVVIPKESRKKLIESLDRIKLATENSSMHIDQKANTINFMNSQIKKLENLEFDLPLYEKAKYYVEQNDIAKKINLKDFCPKTASSMHFMH